METNRALKFNIMEVCGTHTEVIAQKGLRQLYADEIELISGPGCPVCVIPPGEIDLVIELAKRDIVIATFGDMVKVPGTSSSLAKERARGRDIRVVYSPLEALAFAEANPRKPVALLGVGFETTAPLVAATVKMAKDRKLKNFAVLSLHRTMPAVLNTLLKEGTTLQGLLLPGHVCAITGIRPFEFLAKEYGISGVVSGFDPEDVIESIETLRAKRSPSIEIQYRRAVSFEGNPIAQKHMEEVFEPWDANWRGFGKIPASGLRLKEKWRDFDALYRWGDGLEAKDFNEKSRCRCGDVLRGKISPKQCPLFKVACDPQRPQGPCMISSEGACALYFKYEG